MLQTHNKFSVSNILIALCIIFTGLSYLFPQIYIVGMNRYFFSEGNYLIWGVQFFTSNFLHGGILHLLMNSLFVFYFGNILETKIGKQMYLLFFLLNAIFIGVFLTFLSSGNTVGISGFALALLIAYTLSLWRQNNPEYTGGITAIVINILIGFSPGISFLGHFLGMIFGVLFWVFAIKK